MPYKKFSEKSAGSNMPSLTGIKENNRLNFDFFKIELLQWKSVIERSRNDSKTVNINLNIGVSTTLNHRIYKNSTFDLIPQRRNRLDKYWGGV